MLLALDTATPACTAALFDGDGRVLARVDEVMARGHAERLMPLLERMLDGRRADAILVGCGPGSFTGLRVGIAAAHGLALGWSVPVHGFSTMALLAAGPREECQVAVALAGGHGELFVQQFSGADLEVDREVASLAPEAAAAVIDAPLVIGSGAAALVAARGHGEALERLPAAADVLRLPAAWRSMPVRPIYARAPDAKPQAA